MFSCEEYYSEYQLMEVTRHTPLTDKQVMIYYELPKLPEVENAEDESKLWLMLLNAETEEDLKKIEKMGVKIMNEAIMAYRQVSATEEFKEIERLRSRARHNKASALGHARREGRAEGEQAERKKWQGVVAEKDALIKDLQAQLKEGSF